MKSPNTLRLILLAGLAIPTLAVAHPGHGADSGFPLGFAHPFSGADHVAVLLVSGFMVPWLGRARGAMLLAGLLALFVGIHGDWIMPGAEGWGFVAGFLVASALLVGAGICVCALLRRRLTARAARDRPSSR